LSESNPVWWTPTTKAKGFAGIAFDVRFLQSFGFVHGNLNSNTIVFHEERRINMMNIPDICQHLHSRKEPSDVLIAVLG
jgi:hypothetical protein